VSLLTSTKILGEESRRSPILSGTAEGHAIEGCGLDLSRTLTIQGSIDGVRTACQRGFSVSPYDWDGRKIRTFLWNGPEPGARWLLLRGLSHGTVVLAAASAAFRQLRIRTRKDWWPDQREAEQEQQQRCRATAHEMIVLVRPQVSRELFFSLFRSVCVPSKKSGKTETSERVRRAIYL
jgi:hypothetical protein